MTDNSQSEFESEIRLGIARVGGQKIVALKMGMAESDLSRKLSGERRWAIGEIAKFFEIVGLKINHTESNEDKLLVKLLAKKLSETMEV